MRGGVSRKGGFETFLGVGVFYDGAVFSVEKYLYDDSGGNVHNVSIFGTFDTCENNT